LKDKKKRKKGAQKKGGENSPISPPLDPRLQKLERVAEAGKLKFQDNKDQFLFNSELQGTLDETANFLAARDVEEAGEKVEELRKSLRHRQKNIKLADKSEAGRRAVNMVKEYQSKELGIDSEDEKRIKKA